MATRTLTAGRPVLIGMALLAWIGLSGARPAPSQWRSSLYPEQWTPATTDAAGRFLHDFSYAGYRNGAAPLPAGPTRVLNVVKDFGADAAGQRDATGPIQKAIDAAVKAGGGVVLLPDGLFRCDGELLVKGSNVVIRGAGPTRTRLFFTGVPGRGWSNHLSVRGAVRHGKDMPLAADGANRATSVLVADAGELAAGDDIAVGWVITDAFVREHHMAGTWKVFNGKWRPFFLRTIKAVDRSTRPNRIELDVPLRYPAKRRDRASVRRLTGYVSECGVESLAVSNAVEWSAAWRRAGVHAIGLRGVKDGWVRDVVSFASPLPVAKGHHLQGGGVYVCQSKRVTVAGCHMQKAQNRGGGGAGYLFEISRSAEVLTHDCMAARGRHNFIQNWDFGTSGCVWLRCASRDGRGYRSATDPIGYSGHCEYHHSLAMACLVDSCRIDDGWFGGNRNAWSSGAGHTVTQSVYWNTWGKGVIRSWQAGHGYVIGTQQIQVQTAQKGRHARGAEPEDFTEGLGRGAGLQPKSLYADQLARRLERSAGAGE